ncbi:hypothetical protein Leryth_026288 [Lithospermum erythrorhizon]|nr:hypothetical protein Leryth_026288 [Lithospermum erythrorhizon]
MKGLGKNVPELIILPLYSALPSEMQSRIFDPAPPGKRKGLDSLVIHSISQAFAKQRAGRAGRIDQGSVIAYTERVHSTMRCSTSSLKFRG